MTQEVDQLPSKQEALSSNPSPERKKTKISAQQKQCKTYRKVVSERTKTSAVYALRFL
jgi:hypothetical protein